MIKSYKLNNKTFYQIQLSLTDQFGKRHQPKYRKTPNGDRINSKHMAKKLELEYFSKYKAKLDGDLSQFLFSEWHEKYLQLISKEFKRSTIMQYNGDLKKWLTRDLCNKELGKIKSDDLHNFIFVDMPQKGASPNTQKRILKSLRRIFEKALEDGYITRNPASGLKVKVPPPKKKVLNTNEATLLLDKAKEYNHFFYYHWAFALLTGMRNGEIYALRWCDIDLVAMTINVSASWSNKDGYHSTKSNKNRIVPISGDLKVLLLELKNIGPFKENLTGLNGNNQVFENLVLPRSSEWKHGEQSKITRKFCELNSITQVKFHDLRATFITNLLSQGVSLPKVMSIVGHSRTSTTDEYLRLAGVNVFGATDSLGYSLPKYDSLNIISLKVPN